MSAVVHRRDGVSYRVKGQRCGPDLPHDLVHFVVERTLGIEHGFWGRIAAGAVYRSMTHVEGRRLPHAAARSDHLKRDRQPEIVYAELMANLIERIDGLDDSAIRRVTAETLSTLPPPYPSPAELRPALAAVREAQARWRALRPGEDLELTWPG